MHTCYNINYLSRFIANFSYDQECECSLVVIICIYIRNMIYNVYVRMTNFFFVFRLPFDILIVIVFTIEYVGCFLAAPNKWKFAIKPFNLLNLISIIPFYLQIISPFAEDTTLRFTRILRLTRIINSLQRIGKYSDGFLVIIFKIYSYKMRRLILIF